MRYLTADEIIELNASEAGPDRLRNRHLLESAVGRPQQSVFGADAYETIHDKAAALMHSIIGNHAFEDGNKRTAVLAVYTFYGFNGYLFVADEIELIHLAVDVAVNHVDVPKIADHLQAWAFLIPDPE